MICDKINIDSGESAIIRTKFRDSLRRLIILDYDGTLVPLRCDPSRALPEISLLKLLNEISESRNTDLVIISGRDRHFLDSIFTGLSAYIFAEHGALFRVDGKWHTFETDQSWQPEVFSVMNEVTSSVGGSFIEKKESSIVWHYRRSDPPESERIAIKLIEKLSDLCNRFDLSVMKGRKIVEVKPSGYTKGSTIVSHFDCNSYDFILAAGDDITDEELFSVLPDFSIRVHVGKSSEFSTHIIRNSIDFLGFLEFVTR